jgi:hypothetical protein
VTRTSDEDTLGKKTSRALPFVATSSQQSTLVTILAAPSLQDTEYPTEYPTPHLMII